MAGLVAPRAIAAGMWIAACGAAWAGEEHECGRLEAARQALHAAPAFDPHSGQDGREFPPDPQVDFTHIRLNLTFADLMTKSFEAEETVSLRTLARPVERLVLDGVDLAVAEVLDGEGRALGWRYDDERLTIRFEPALSAESPATVVIRYTCSAPESGMWFALPDEAYRSRPLHVHTQGQASENRHWFFSHDYPNERATTEIVATVPKPYQVLANGALLGREDVGTGSWRWHYRLDQPHPAYLVSLVIGEFEVVRQEWNGIPVEYWVPPGQGQDALRTFDRTPKMLEVFSEVLGAPYPYAKYAQSVCHLFQWGGMENTSTTTLYETVVHDERALLDGDADELIAHELAHQWFGDMVTCRTWAHLWLNEGFATYMEYVWYEHGVGPEHYEYEMWSMLKRVAEREKVDTLRGLSSPHIGQPLDFADRPASDPYSKGASVIHMLRRKLGDELFWRCIREYVRRYQWREAESDDLRRVCEELSGLSLERFWGQWVHRAGAPELKIGYAWDDARREARVELEQTQALTNTSPAFEFDLDVWFVYDDERIERHVLPVDGRRETLVVTCAEEPRQVCVDPRASVIAKFTFDLPGAMLVEQVRAGPTVAARLHAIAALAKSKKPAARAALRDVLLDPAQFDKLRSTAAGSLGRMQTDEARAILLAALRPDDPIANLRVRRATVAALGDYRSAEVVPALLAVLQAAASDGLIDAACDGLGNQDPTPEIAEALLAAAGRSSRDDRVRKSALRALAKHEELRAIEPAMALARYGGPYRSRSTGISVLGTLGAAAEDAAVRGRVREFLLGLLGDPQDKAAQAVGPALGRLGDEKAIEALRAFSNGAAAEGLRTSARNAIDAIRRKQGESEVVGDLRARVKELEAYVEQQKRKAEEHRADESAAGAASAPASQNGAADGERRRGDE